MFIGEYKHTIDEKGRLAIPVKFRQDLARGAVVTRGLDASLFLFPKEEWDKLAEKLFPGSEPMEKTIDISGVPFRVLGIYHNVGSFLGKPSSASAGNDPRAIVPLESGVRNLEMYMRRLDLTVKPRANVTQVEAIDAVTTTMRGLRGLRPSTCPTARSMRSP